MILILPPPDFAKLATPLDGSKLDGRVGVGFYAEYPRNSPKPAFFHLGIHSTVFQAEVLAIPEAAKNLLLEKNSQS